MGSFIVILVIIFVICYIRNFIEIKAINKNKTKAVNNNIYTNRDIWSDHIIYSKHDNC